MMVFPESYQQISATFFKNVEDLNSFGTVLTPSPSPSPSKLKWKKLKSFVTFLSKNDNNST